MKKFLPCLIVTFTVFLYGIGLSACDLISKTYKVSSVEDLYAMEKGKDYELMCDLNLEGQVWSPLPVRNFNGNGYSISNVTVNGVYREDESRLGFFSSAYGISNVTFDNVNIAANFSESAQGYICGGIVCGFLYDYSNKTAYLENVTVKNSSFIVTSLAKYGTYIGGICGYNNGLIIKNCTVQDCNITYVAAKSYNDWLHVGGVVGYSALTKDVSDCKLLNSTITCTGLSYVNLGGIVGEKKNGGNIVNCVAGGNKISLDTKGCNYSSRLGAIVGNTDADACVVENSGAKNNVLKVEAKYSYNVGGVIARNCGTVKNCLSDGNVVTATILENKDNNAAYAGGFCGSNNGTISRSLSQNCSVSGTEYGLSTSTEFNKFTAGFAANNTGSLAYCGVNDNTVSGGWNLDFSTNINNTFNCLQEATAEEWASVIQTLNLDADLWSYSDGLKLNILEG